MKEKNKTKTHMDIIASKIELQCKKDTWFVMGEIPPQIAVKWNEHAKCPQDRLYVIERNGSQCAYIHYGTDSKEVMICNGVVFGTAWCQFFKQNRQIFVILKFERGEWNFPQMTLRMEDIEDRAIDYDKLGKEFHNPSFFQNDCKFHQTWDIESQIHVGHYNLKKETHILISKHCVHEAPILGCSERSIRLPLHPSHCTLALWMKEQPWNLQTELWLMIFCCYKKTNWTIIWDDVFRELHTSKMKNVRFSVPSCLQVSVQKINDTYWNTSVDDNIQNTEAHVHAKTKQDLQANFDPILWFHRNKYGLLPLHTAILFQNFDFVDCFLASTLANNKSKLMFQFANRRPVNPDEFRNIVANHNSNVKKDFFFC